MRFILKIIYQLYLRVPFLGKFWRETVPKLVPQDFTLSVTVEGSKLNVLKNHWASIMLGYYEPHTLETFKQLLSKEKTFIDIGANIGLFSSIALSSGANVIAFEPHPRIRKILESNVVKRGAKVYPFALSDENAEVKLFLSDEVGSHSLSLETDDYVTVKAMPLDSIITGKVDVIKIDVEGAEIKVLKGMKNLLKNHKPDLIIEVEEEHLRRFGDTSASLIAFLDSLGYNYQKIQEEPNYLFTDKEKTKLLK